MRRYRTGLLSFVLVMNCIPTVVLAVTAGKTITWDGGGQGRVIFEGKEHAEEGYTCNACHPALFQMKKGATAMMMDALNKGRFCGHCHDGRTAFSTSDRNECHECHKAKKKHRGNNGHHEHNEIHHD